jgi:hypothetical protein
MQTARQRYIAHLFFPDTATIRTSLDSRGVFGRYHVTVRLRAALVVAGIA